MFMIKRHGYPYAETLEFLQQVDAADGSWSTDEPSLDINAKLELCRRSMQFSSARLESAA